MCSCLHEPSGLQNTIIWFLIPFMRLVLSEPDGEKSHKFDPDPTTSTVAVETSMSIACDVVPAPGHLHPGGGENVA